MLELPASPYFSHNTLMRYLDLTLPSLAENLALDEALLDEAQAAAAPLETLRTWEAAALGVVVGRSSRVNNEVRGEACRAAGVPVLRRISGGAAVVVGPGCLMYALVLSLRLRPQLRNIDQAHAQVLGTIAAALRPAASEIARRGTCDLAIGEKKVSGNSVRCRRDYLLYHGTLLYDFPLERIGRLLAMPPRQPDYRRARAARGVRGEPALGRGRAPRCAAPGMGCRRGMLAVAASRDRTAGCGKVLAARVERTVVRPTKRR